MEISEKTIEVLRNFSAINQSMIFRTGNIVKTLSNNGAVMGSAEVPEAFPVECGIYDMPKFLNTLKLYSEPVLDWQNEFVGISEKAPDGDQRMLRYLYSKKDTIHSPKKDLPIPATEVNFKLKEEDLKSLHQASSILGLTYLMITPSENNNKVNVSIVDVKKLKGTKFTIEVDAEIEANVKNFQLFYIMENLKLLGRDYDVAITKALYSHWFGTDVEYFIALDKASKMEVS